MPVKSLRHSLAFLTFVLKGASHTFLNEGCTSAGSIEKAQTGK